MLLCEQSEINAWLNKKECLSMDVDCLCFKATDVDLAIIADEGNNGEVQTLSLSFLTNRPHTYSLAAARRNALMRYASSGAWAEKRELPARGLISKSLGMASCA